MSENIMYYDLKYKLEQAEREKNELQSELRKLKRNTG